MPYTAFKGLKLFSTEADIFREYQVDAMATDALALSVDT